MRVYRIFLTIILISLLSNAKAQFNNIELEPTGIYKEIDVKAQNEMVAALADTTGQRKEAVKQVINNPNRYNPVVLYFLSHVLFNDNKKDDAMYWFYLAQLRARYDANRCADKTAVQGVTILNQSFGPSINEYAYKNIPLLKSTVEKVVEFVRNNRELYDQRWLNLHGIGAISSGLGEKDNAPKLSLPEKDWPEIKNKTVDTYYSDFKRMVK